MKNKNRGLKATIFKSDGKDDNKNMFTLERLLFVGFGKALLSFKS